MAFQIKSFVGILKGKKSVDFVKKLDFSIKKQKDRLKLVQDILYTKHNSNSDDYPKHLDPYFETYFDEKFNCSPTKEQNISTENNVCSSLEAIANYLLFAADAPRIEKMEYNFYTENKLREKMGREISLDALVESTYKDVENDQSMSFIVDKSKNYKKIVKQVITKKDIKEIKPINDYEDLKILLMEKLNYLREEKLDKNQQRKISSFLKDIKGDQINCKDMILGTIYFKAPLSDSTEIDYDCYDMLDYNHVKALLCCSNTNVLTDLGCLGHDLNNTIESLKLNKDELKVLDMYKNGEGNQRIINSIYKGDSDVGKVINSICNRIIKKNYEEYENWYYTEICKGKYKRCCRCGEVKLISNFGKHSLPKDKLYPCCKNCR